MTVVSEQPRAFQPGQPFLHYPYLVDAFLGEGASGQVYAIHHRFTGDRFALKVSHLHDRREAEKVARALIEARATYFLRHANVVRVVDLACEADGTVWQIMELLEGQTVAALLDRFGPFSPLHAVDVAAEVVCGLQAAHEQQIVHRDVQPSNVFFTRDGQVKLLDFSLARVGGSGLVTGCGRGRMGTAGYMAPEHLRGEPPTPGFDVYAVGILFWEMLVGHHPFVDPRRGPEAMGQLVDRVLGADPESLVSAAGLPEYADAVLRGATHRDPLHRFPDMWSLARALADLRARLIADPAMAPRLRLRPAWEVHHPVRRAPEGESLYRAPRSLPRHEAPPALPSQRVVVTPPSGTPAVSPPALPPTTAPSPLHLPVASPAPPPAATARMRTFGATRRWRIWPAVLALGVVAVVAAGLTWALLPEAVGAPAGARGRR